MWAGELRHEQQQECLLPELHVVGGEEAVAALADASPPAVVDHLDVGDDVVGVEGDLVVTRSLVIVKGYGCDPEFIFVLIIRVFF